MFISNFGAKSCRLCRYYTSDFCAVAPDYIGLSHLCQDFELGVEEDTDEIEEIPLIEQLKKDYLFQLLSYYGEIETGRTVISSIKKDFDLWFAPNKLTKLIKGNSLFKKLTKTRALFENYHYPLTSDDVGISLLKWMEVSGEFTRLAKAKNKKIPKSELPKLWILTPTIADEEVITGFGAAEKENEISGVYFLAPIFSTGIIVIDRLPVNQDTLWLRILTSNNQYDRTFQELLDCSKNNGFYEKVKESAKKFLDL